MNFARLSLLPLILVLGLSGCSAVQLVVPFAPEMQRLRDGESEFEHGNYSKADAIFAEIYDSEARPQTKNTALYNLACTRMITADDSVDFIAAINLLDGWLKTSPSAFYVENPNLVITALKEKASLLEINREEVLQQEKKNQAIITRQNTKIAELNILLKTLQHQITELEAIDQQLMEKRKPL